MRQSEIVAAASQAAVRAIRAENSLDPSEDARFWEAMYQGQCEATDEWAKRARAAEQAKAPDTLQKRIDDLERDLARVNSRLTSANAGEPGILFEAAKRARDSLDDCNHPECVETRARRGYSSCAGGHLARRVVKAIHGTEALRDPA